DAYLREGRDSAAAEQALRDVLALDPAHPAARRNLEILLRRQGPPAGEGAPPTVPQLAPAAAPPGRPSVSVTMIVRDEEANLPECLRALAGLEVDLVVVDTGSADRTKEVAAAFGARVFDFPWRDDFAAARNEALRHATGAWVFWLDADDRLDDANRERLIALFAGLKDEGAAYAMTCRCAAGPGASAAEEVSHL